MGDGNPLLEGLTGTSDDFVASSTASRLDEDQCKIATLVERGLLLGNDRDDDRLRLTRYSLNHPEGVPISQIWRDVFGRSGPVEPGDSDYQFSRRFYTGNDEFFDTFDQNGMTAVEPDLSLFDLITQGIVQKSESGPSTNRQVARSLLSSVSSLNGDGKDILSSEIQRYIGRISDWRLLFRATDARTGDESLFMKPYKTRFNDLGRINQQWARYNQALDYARNEFSNAALVTLTTDPKKFPHLLAMTDEITGNFNRLMSWMGYDCEQKETSRPGYRPPYLRVLEFTDDGKPHLHILFFGVPEKADGTPWLIDKQELSGRWDDLGQGRIVDVQGLTYCDDLGDDYDRDDGFVALDESDDDARMMADGVGGGQTAGQYLGKYLSSTFGGLMATAGNSVALSRDFQPADDDKSDAFKIALYWATGKRIWACSKDIEQAIEPDEDEPNDLPILIEYIGAYPYWDLPASVISNIRPLAEYENAVHSDNDPEPESGSGGDRPPPEPA